MPPLFKSILLIGIISTITFGVTCGGTILIIIRGSEMWSLGGWILIILGIVIFLFLLRKYLKIYIWKYLGIAILLVILTNIFGYGTILLGNETFTRQIPGLDLLISILSLLGLILSVYIFHFYRMKALVEIEKGGNIMSDIQLIFHNIFDPIVRFFTGNRPPIQTHYTIPEVPITPSPESIDLMNTLAHVDITGIHAVKFTTKKGSQFQIGTENMKRLAKYISTTMGKTEFIAHELDTVFSYVTKNLYSKIPGEKRKQIIALLSEFVEYGGTVEYISE